jgi:N6-L-threonylcarbamoyladenine synthase
MLHSGDLSFSFSGLKTAVLTQVRYRALDEAEKADLCAEFQAAIVEVLAAKALAALKETGLKQLVVAGGVGANRALRAALDAGTRAAGARVFYPELELCTDNGAMIAFAGAQRLTFAAATAKQAGSFGVKPRWALQEV